LIVHIFEAEIIRPLSRIFLTFAADELIFWRPNSTKGLKICLPELELGRCRFFRSMSVSILFFDFLKVDVDFGFGFYNYRDIGVGVDFLTNILLFQAIT